MATSKILAMIEEEILKQSSNLLRTCISLLYDANTYKDCEIAHLQQKVLKTPSPSSKGSKSLFFGRACMSVWLWIMYAHSLLAIKIECQEKGKNQSQMCMHLMTKLSTYTQLKGAIKKGDVNRKWKTFGSRQSDKKLPSLHYR